MPSIQSTWLKLDAIAHLCPNQDDAGYEQMVVSMSSAVLDVVGADDGLALAGLLERVGDLVSAWERERFPIAPHRSRKTSNS